MPSRALDGLPPADTWPQRTFADIDPPYPEWVNVAIALLDVHLRGGQSRPALWFQGRCYTYGELGGLVAAAQAGLARAGVGPGDRVMLQSRNRPELVAAWLAVVRSGAVAVTVHPALTGRELDEIARDALPGAFVREAGGDAGTATPPCLALTDDRGGRFLFAAGRVPLPPPAATRRDDIALIAYTSGSTGRPKGAAHAHEDLLAIADTYSRVVIGPGPDDVFASASSLAFTFGLGALLIFPLRVGASALLTLRFTAEDFLAELLATGASILFGVPTVYHRLLETPAALADLRLRRCVSAAAPLPSAVAGSWMHATGLRILQGIGSTEMLHIFLSEGLATTGEPTCGLPVPGYEVRIVDENLRDVPEEAPGLLAVRGPTGCRYWRRPEQQRAYVRDGWNVTGDLFHRTPDGALAFFARADDVIMTAGYKVAPQEVEDVLAEHPAVGEVAVVGHADEARGAVVSAAVVLRPGWVGSTELRDDLAALAARRLAVFKRPRTIEFVAALPHTPTGKLQRSALRRAGSFLSADA
jgi:2-aminobenzoate-CoA ligase